LEKIQKQLTAIIAISYILIPTISFAVGLSLGIISLNTIQQANSMSLLLITSVIILGVSIYYFSNYLTPVKQLLQLSNYAVIGQDHSNISDPIHKHLTRFSRQYWGLCLPFILLLPLSYQAARGDQLSYVVSWQTLHITLLTLIVTITVALPGYLLSLTVIGKLSQHIGLKNIQVSLKTKMMLVGGYIPLIITGIILAYFSWRTGSFAGEIIVIWLLSGASAFISTLIATNSLKSSLQPINNVFLDIDSPTHANLATKLIPHSTDEIGLLMQTLRHLFTRLGEQESYVQAIFNHAAEAIIVSNDSGKIVLYNPAAEKLFDYKTKDIELYKLKTLLPNIIHNSGKPNCIEDKIESEAVRRDGSLVPIKVSITELRMNDSICYAYLVQDISKRKAAEVLLQNAEDRYRTLVETAHDLVWSMDATGVWTYLNNAVTHIYGYEIKDMIGQNFREFQAPVSASQDKRAFKQLLLGEELVQYETILKHKDGTQRHISFNAKPVLDESNNITSITGTARDITDQKAYENELTYQSEHDTLTGLLNRRYFHQELTRVIARVARSGMECALLYIDLDQFKYINDTLGHAAGDTLLIECTNLLQKHTRDGDMLARFGGDEFTILLYNIAPSKAETVAENLRDLFDQYRFYQNGKAYNVTCSIGLSIIDNNITTPDEALSRADLACHVAKAQGRNCVHTSNKRDEEKMGMSEDMGWAARVRDAYENDKFQLMYQPIYSISNKNVEDYEVLLRIPLSDGGMILPGGFIPAAERFGLIHHVDRWTVRKAITTLSELINAGHNTRFAINLSGRAFEDQELLPLIANMLKETGLNPELLTFEITETEAIENLASATTFICKLKDLGCKFALDDFGSGFSSFNYLKNLPVDILKIDGSFVQALHKTHVDQAMVQSMNQIAHALGKKTIAEFVENNDTLSLLEGYGVDFAQGHYLGRPKLDVLGDIKDRKSNTKTVSEDLIIQH
jgi:diguanylate cyclase (GGDEF)-like protein/PAS domain S-box-containing protein